MVLENIPVKAWTSVIEDLLYRAPPGERLAILEAALAKERQKRAKPDLQARTWDASEINPEAMEPWHDRFRIKAATVCSFVRSITNNHSPDAARALLFRWHRGIGSGHQLWVRLHSTVV
jgi:hypothetical protein